MKKINLFLLTIISLILLVSVNAATVSHPAPEITAGTFGGGDYIFPNNLDVGGIIQVGRFSSKPTCNADSIGGLVFDTTANKPYVCASGGWKPLDSDNDEDGLIDWLDSNDNSYNPKCSADNGGQCYISQGSKSILDGDLASGNIKSGVNIFGVGGSLSCPTCSPTPPTCSADNGGHCYISQGSKSALDDDLSANNIKQGVNIFGVTGSLEEGKGLLSTDIVASGTSRPRLASTPCNQPSDRGRRCDAYYYHYYNPWDDWIKYDPRGVLTTSYSQAPLPCYEIPDGSWRPCGAQKTYRVFQSFSCSGGFTADSSNPIAQSLARQCQSQTRFGCRAAICRPP